MDVMLIKFTPDVPGQSYQDGHLSEIELLSYSHGVSMQITGDISNTERTSGKPNHQDFTVTKYLDKATPKLNEACCKGDNFTTAVLTVGRNDKGTLVPLIVYTLQNVVISSVSVGGGGGDKPVETLSLNYNHIKWDYHTEKAEGGEAGHVDANWNLATNKNA